MDTRNRDELATAWKPHRYNFSVRGAAHHHSGHIAAGSVVHVSDITSPDQVKVYPNKLSAGGGHLKGTGLAASYNKVPPFYHLLNLKKYIFGYWDEQIFQP